MMPRVINAGNAGEMAVFCRSLAGSDTLKFKVGAVTESGMADVVRDGKDVTLVFHKTEKITVAKPDAPLAADEASHKKRGRPAKKKAE
jgi:hypothetical protein